MRYETIRNIGWASTGLVGIPIGLRAILGGFKEGREIEEATRCRWRTGINTIVNPEVGTVTTINLSELEAQSLQTTCITLLHKTAKYPFFKPTEESMAGLILAPLAAVVLCTRALNLISPHLRRSTKN